VNSDDDLVPLDERQDGNGFDIVLRGYDRRQVEDYIRRVELALSDADRNHREDFERITQLESDLLAARSQLADAERRLEGRPEAPSAVGERIASLLRLAEEEADEIVAQARERAATSTSERNAELDAREARISGAAAEAERTRLEAQQDAESLRAKAEEEAARLVRDAEREAEDLLRVAIEEAERRKRTAEEDIRILHDDARQEGRAIVADARAEVEDLRGQREAITRQLDELRATLAKAMQPLSGPTQPSLPEE
jgi:cell division septum initiation protein DivIVA